MKNRPFLIFSVILGFLVSSMLWYIQSPQFAQAFKRIASKYIPQDIGIDGDFSEFRIKLFPPGVSIRNPKIVVKKQNIVNLPSGSTVTAKRMDLNFVPFQMFSGNVRIHEAIIVDGDVQLVVEQGEGGLFKKKTKKPTQMGFHWDDLLQIRADAVALENTRLLFKTPKSEKILEIPAETFRVEQNAGANKGGAGYAFTLSIGAASGTLLNDWPSLKSFETIKAKAFVNAQGVQLEQLALKSGSIEADGSGAIKGDILNPKNLNAEGALTLRGQIPDFLKLIPKKAQKSAKVGKQRPVEPATEPEADGMVAFSGKIKANLDRFFETLRAEGSLTGEKIRFHQWKADTVHAEGGFVSAGEGGGEISVTKASISAQEIQREGGLQPGHGGKVEIGAFKLALGSTQPVTIPLVLERAHIHWLAAPALKDVYGLNFRASGPVAVTYTPKTAKQPWNIQARLSQFTVNDFQLDNQRLGQTKKMHQVLNIRKINLEGPVTVDSGAVRFANVSVWLPKTKIQASGKVDFKTGYDIRAAGTANLEDVGQIAENDVRGTGSLALHVHGPTSDVQLDFDADVADARYLNLDLGKLKGRITWDDGKDDLLFTNVQLEKGQSAYTGNGIIDLGKVDTIDLKFQVPNGNIQDFIRTFDHFVKDLWWFPDRLNGPVSGEIRVTGGLDLKELQVQAKMNGTNWDYYGERIKAISLHGGYDRGRYHIADMKMTKKFGSLSGHISYDREHRFDWDLKSRDLLLSDLDHLAKLDVPIRGRLEMQSTGKGPDGAVEASTLLSLSDLSVRGVGMPASQLSMKTRRGVAVVKGVALGGQGNLELEYDFAPGASSSIRGELKALDFSPVLLLLNPRLIQDPALVGTISGSINVAFQSGRIERGTGKFEITDYVLSKTGSSFRLLRPVSTRMNAGTFDFIAGLRSDSGEAIADIQSRNGIIDGKIFGDIDLSFVEFITSSVTRAEGAARVDVHLNGPIKEPVVAGKARIENATVRVASLESPFENLAGSFQLKQNVLTVQDLTADLAGGKVAADGNVKIFADRYPAVSLRGTLAGNKLKVYPFNFVKVNGSLRVHGDEPPYFIDGSIAVISALTREKIFNKRSGESLKAAQYTPMATSQQESGSSKFKLNIDVDADRGILIQNDLFDAEVKGRFTLVNTLEAPRVLGTAEVVQGKMHFRDRTFLIQSASARFDSPTVLNPDFNLSSTTEVNGVKIQLYASGRLDKLKIDLNSTPVMQESEILNLLALGISSNEFRRLKQDRSVLEQGEAAMLLLHALDFNREVQSKTGLQIQLDEAVNPQQGASIFRPQNPTDSAATPKIVIKRRIGEKLDLSYGNTVGVGSQNQKEVNAELHVKPGVSIIGVWDNYETVDSKGNRSSTSVGFDVKLQKRFK